MWFSSPKPSEQDPSAAASTTTSPPPSPPSQASTSLASPPSPSPSPSSSSSLSPAQPTTGTPTDANANSPAAVVPMPESTPKPKPKVPLSTHLIAGGIAGLAEACVCHPLDTIKVRMQLSKSRKMRGLKPLGFYATAQQIVARETPLGLYKGLGAVASGIVPKMAIRFASFEAYKRALTNEEGKLPSSRVFLAGLLAGATEAVVVVSPMEVIKIRLQAQHHSLADPMDIPKYRSAPHALFTIVREEGISTLYRGVALTALRQATNQGVNFTAYQEFKRLAQDYQPQYADAELPSWQTLIIGLVSGAMGPFSNAPIDTIKTRIQKASKVPGETAFSRFMAVTTEMFKQEGPAAFYKGIFPRVLRVAPGQAIVFTVYERVKGIMDNLAAKKEEYLEFDSEN